MNKYQQEQKLRSKKFIKYKKFFNSKNVSIRDFEKRINVYFDVYKSFWEWRKNFKYPQLNYLQKLKTLKPQPPDDLIKNLAKCISELKTIYLDLSDHRAIIIFKLFSYYIAQCLKAEFKIKYYKQGWFRDTPVDLDINNIVTSITEYYLNIKDIENDPLAKNYSCWCGKYKKKQKKGFVCEVKGCDSEVSKLPRKPWNSNPKYFTSSDIGPLNHFNQAPEYKRHEKELLKLLKIKNKRKLLTVKHPISKQVYQVTPNEMIVDNFFRLNFHNDNEEIEKIVFNKKIEIKDTKKKIILNKDEKNIEYYWGDAENSKPHGKGISEKYETDDTIKKVFKKVGMMWWKKYSKNLNAKDLKGYIINEKYDGEWKNGKRHGKGELIIFQDPAYVSNKDWTPSIMEKYIGTFQNGEMHGEIKQYDDISKEWTLTSYKNGVAGKSVKINKK